MKIPNPQRAKELRIKRLFNLSMEEYDSLGNFCWICGVEGKTREIAVDHRHSDGLIRGRLCMRHNKGLALFSDDFELLLAAADYVRIPPAITILGEERYGRTGRVNKKVGKKKKK